jgi:hypothetical protein
LGQFDAFMDDTSGVRKVLDRDAIKALGALPFSMPLAPALVANREAKIAPQPQPQLPDPRSQPDQFSDALLQPAQPKLSDPSSESKVDADLIEYEPQGASPPSRPLAVVPSLADDGPETRRSTRRKMPTVTKLLSIPDKGVAPSAFVVSSPDAFCDASLLVTCCMMTEASLQTITPRNVREAMESPQRAQWIAAMDREKACHIKNGTFSTAVASEVELAKKVQIDSCGLGLQNQASWRPH